MAEERMPGIFIKSLVVCGLAGIAYYFLHKSSNHACQGLVDRDLARCILQEISEDIGKKKALVQANIDSAGKAIDERLATALADLKDLILSKDMQGALDTISGLIDQLSRFDMDAKSYASPIFLLFALLKRVQNEETEGQDVVQSEVEIQMTPTQLWWAKRLGGYAVNVYPASWAMSNESAAKTLGVPSDAVLFTWFQDSEGTHCPKFALIKDIEDEAIVLVIRGTFSFKDVIADAICEESPFLDGFAHRGFLEGGMKIISLVKETLQLSLEENPGYKFTITGHSMGAGTAELLYLEFMLGDAKYLLPAGTKVECLALAPPPIYRSSTELSDEIKKNLKIIIFNNDIVPRLSLANIAKMLRVLRKMDDLNVPLYSLVSIITDNMSEEDQMMFTKLKSLINQEDQTTFAPLDHPADIIHIRRTEEKLRLYKAEPLIFSKAILLLENMILDHIHNEYARALESL